MIAADHRGSRTDGLLLGLSLIGAALVFAWILQRPVAWDEFEFYRATAWVGEGRSPYLDFWEHHSPLQWFVYGLLPRQLSTWNGVGAIQFMRWAQLPLWGITLWFCVRSPAQNSQRAWSMAVLLLSPAFLMFAVEYRVDAMASGLLVLGLVAAQGPSAPLRLALGGGLLALVPWANLRLGPPALAALAVLSLVDPERRKWCLGHRATWTLAGAGAISLLMLSYLSTTGSLALAWEQLIIDNHIVASLSPSTSRAFWDLLGITLTEKDPVPVLLLAGGTFSAVRAATEWRHPGPLQIVAFVFLVNLALVYGLNTHYFYHFQTLLLLALPLNADLLRWLVERHVPQAHITWTVLALALWTVGLNVHGLLRTRAEGRLAYQDELLRSVHALTRPDEKVWDGTGFALHREPAYKYWFLPVHARLLARSGRFEPLTLAGFQSAAPAALFLHARTFNWLQEWPDLRDYVHTNYLPVRPHLWIPAPNVRLSDRGTTHSWRVLRTGSYRLLASKSFANHPYFKAPYLYMDVHCSSQAPGITIALSDSGAPAAQVSVRVNGRLVVRGEPIDLKLNHDDLLEIRSEVPAAIGVFLFPLQVSALFVPSPCRGGPDAPLYGYF